MKPLTDLMPAEMSALGYSRHLCMAGRHRTHKRPSRVAAGGLVGFPLTSEMAVDSSVCAAEQSTESPLSVMKAQIPGLPIDTYS